MPLTADDNRRYHRQIFLPSIGLEGMEKLRQAKVLVIGAGGLGSTVAQFLCGAGIGTLTLVDFDSVDLSNLHRQLLYKEADVGELKVDAAKRNLSALNSGVQVNTIPEALSGDKLLEQVSAADVIVDCTDNLAIRNELAEAAWQLNKPLVSGSAIRLEGQLFVQLPGANNPCYHCLSAQFNQPSLSCVENGVLGPVVGLVGNMQALEVIKICCGIGTVDPAKLALFDALASEWVSFKLKKSASCKVCA